MTIKCCRCHSEVAAGICHECRDGDIIRAVADLTKKLVETEAQNTRNFVASNHWREKALIATKALNETLSRIGSGWTRKQLEDFLNQALKEIEG